MKRGEITATAFNFLSMASHTAGTLADTLAGVMFLIPDFRIGGSGFGGSPHFTAVPPTGDKPAKASERAANGLYNIATILDKNAGLAATLASYQRRQEEWDFQQDLAVKELEQVDKQIAAAELRIAIAEKELENHVLQIDNAKATDAFMRSKYTNEELFQWQVGQISGVFFQSYKLAYDLAKRSERCFRFELGVQDSSYIQFGYWDSLKKGLLSGEKLQYDLRRLESAYIEQNRREFELTKHVSLALLNPLALVQLKETGRCFFGLPEEILDLDYPGHYFRRIKSASITLPCVTGPYTTVSCTLRLLKNYIRINTELTDGYAHAQDDTGAWTDDPRFVESSIPVKAIAASNAQNDSGVFELSFRDERYLPFEGAGAVSYWSLELFSDINADFGKPLRQFDYDTITDAVVHIKYMAR
ncbi:MAG: neuraminidase-like domain-containing protein, partial [Pyrinomonadaceae bacterium]